MGLLLKVATPASKQKAFNIVLNAFCFGKSFLAANVNQNRGFDGLFFAGTVAHGDFDAIVLLFVGKSEAGRQAARIYARA